MNSISNFLKPERMYKFNVWMTVFNLALAVACLVFGLDPSIGKIFLASGLCFVVSGLANWWILKIKAEHKTNK